jgi:hypothetical protein
MRSFALWSFPEPRDDETALSIFERLGVDHWGEQSSHLLAFIADITSRYPDLDDSGNGVWGEGPLAGCVVGNLLVLRVREHIDEVLPFLIERALAHHVNVFDVEAKRLLTGYASPDEPR